MSLRDELPSQNAITFGAIKTIEQDEISRHISEFIACGGTITQVPIGASVDSLGRHHIRNEFTGAPDYDNRAKSAVKPNKVCSRGALLFDSKKRISQRSQYGQNLVARGKGDKRYFVLIIGF